MRDGPPTAQPVGRSSSYLTGTVWAGLNAATSVLLPFALFVFFAREISPPLLGLVALVTACIEVFKAVGLPGVYEALLQQKTEVHRCHETALALVLCASAALAPLCLAFIWGLGYLVTGLHQHFVLLAVLVLRIPLDLAIVQPQAVLVVRLAFHRLAMRTILANGVAGCLGILVASFVRPVAGLVVYQLVQSGLTFATTAFGRGLMARPILHRDCIGRLHREMLLSTGNRALAATINYVDQMILAPLAGDTPLAYYNLGKRIETTFVTVANSFSAILFQPLFAVDGVLSKQKATVRALFLTTLICGIPAAVSFSNSSTVVGLLFGHSWLAASPVVGWLSLNGFVRAVGMVPGSFLSVSGRNRDLLVTSVASALGSLALVAAFASSSIALCAASLVVKNAVIVGWMAWLCRRDTGRPALTYVVAVIIPLTAMTAAASAATVLLPTNLVSGPLRAVLTLACSGAGALCCGGLWIAPAYLLSGRLADRIPMQGLQT